MQPVVYVAIISTGFDRWAHSGPDERMTQPTNMRFVALDSWRGICACLVAVFHFPAFSHIYDLTFIRNSDLFVDFFFVLSGFIISYTYTQRLTCFRDLQRFIFLRFFRLYPLHLFMLLLFVQFKMFNSGEITYILTHETNNLYSIVSNLLLINGLNVHASLTWNVPSWSISTEIFTYLIFAVLVVMAPGRHRYWIGVLSVVSLVLLVTYHGWDIFATNDYGLLRCVYGFCTGVLVYRLYASAWMDRQFRPFVSARADWVELICVSVVLLSVMTPVARSLSLLAPLMFAGIVLIFADEAGMLSRILRRPGFLLIGTLSYSIYMTHYFIQLLIKLAGLTVQEAFGEPVFTPVRGTDAWHLGLGTQPWHGDIAYIVMLSATVAFSRLVYCHIEEPARLWSKRKAAEIWRDANK